MPTVSVSKLFSGSNQETEEFGAKGRFVVQIDGGGSAWAATIVLLRKQGSGNWVQVSVGGVPLAFVNNDAVEVMDEPLDGARYKLKCTAYTSGSPTGSIIQ